MLLPKWCLDQITARFLPNHGRMKALITTQTLLFVVWMAVTGSVVSAQPLTETERLINTYLQAYPFSPGNSFRLATYLELKGRYHPAHQAMKVEFGGLGSLTFYERNCLLRVGSRGVYTLNQRHVRPEEAAAMNRALDALFERIFLMGNAGLEPGMVRFVERYLSRKNIGAFDKILLRHLLVRFGRYDSVYQRVELRTEWLPDLTFDYRAPGDRSAHRKPKTPLYIKLDKNVLRGYYLRTHGTVFVENVVRDVLYATGEVQAPNVTAFKAFAQHLFTQNTLYLVEAEQKRLASLEIKSVFPATAMEAGDLPMLASDGASMPVPGHSRTAVPSGYQVVSRSEGGDTEHIYHPYHWVPMMLGLLRSKEIRVADPDILPYFIGEPYFEFLYQLLDAEERMEVDLYRESHLTE